jgi:hypothetical protein
MNSNLRRSRSLTRPTFAKIIALVIAVCVLPLGIAPANVRCTASCCAQSSSQDMDHGNKFAVHDLVSKCCTGSEQSTCDLMSDSAQEVQDAAISAFPGGEDHFSSSIAVVKANVFFSSQSNLHVARKVGPPIRGPGAPLYLQNLSLLI